MTSGYDIRITSHQGQTKKERENTTSQGYHRFTPNTSSNNLLNALMAVESDMRETAGFWVSKEHARVYLHLRTGEGIPYIGIAAGVV